MTRPSTRRVAARWRSAKGATLIEAAIITPLLLLLTFSIVDFAALFYVYLALENGVSHASRYGVTGNTMDDPGNPGTQLDRVGSMKAAMRDATPTLTLGDDAFSFSHMSPGGTAWVGGVGGPRDIDRVTVNYTYSLLTPVLKPFFTGGQITFTVDSAMKNEGRFE